MALNVTTAVFRPGFNIATASPSLVQWDQGQTLQFEGVELPSAYQVEFTNAVTVQAITMIGNENGVEIPNELLQQSFPINAYIVLHETAEDRETEYWATIYVKARQQPREETPDPEQISVIDQTIAALQEGVAEAQAASQAVQNMGVEAETLPEGSQATVEKTVDPDTGAVTLGFGIPEGRHGATGATPDIQIGTVTTGAPGSQAAASITGTREEPRLNLTIPQGPQGDAGVTSVNGKTGAVTLDAADVGAYAKPSGGIPKTDLDQSVQTSLGLANTALQSAPVTSVNNKTGAVVLSASDVGAKPASYEAPVSSVNEKTGAVVLDAGDIGYESTTVEDELGTINSALTSLDSKISDINRLVTPENIFDRNTMEENGKWWTDTNPVSTATASAYTAIKIPIDNPSSISIKQDKTIGNVEFFEWYAVDADMVKITKERPAGTPSIKNGYTISNIPSTAKYLLLSLRYYSEAEAEGKYLSVVVGTTPKDYTPYFEPYYQLVIPDDAVTTAALADGCVTPEKTSFMVLNHGENLFDFDTMTLENKWYTGFTVGSKAAISDLASQFHDTYIAFQIPLWKAEPFVMSAASSSSANIFTAALVDENDTVLSVVASGAALKNGIVVANVPQNAVAIYGTIQYWKSELIDKNTSMMVSYGTTAKDYVPYVAPWWDVPNKKADEAYEIATELETSKRSVMYISKETNDTALLLKMLEAFNQGNVDVYFEKSTYTLTDAYLYMWNTLIWRWGNGLPVGNGCRYFFNDSTIISNCPANPPELSNAERNVIDCRTMGSDYEIHDVTLINNGGRYCIHDEGNNSTTPYCHKYENVVMIYNKTEITPDTGSKAFGCGTGFDATLIFDGCVFFNDLEQNTTPLAIHAPTTNPDNDPCKLHLIMKNSYINKGTISLNVFDGTRDTLDFFLFGNKFGTAFSDPIVNLIENNNTVIS